MSPDLLTLREIVHSGAPASATLATVTLTLGDRRKSRLRLTLDDGREAALMLTRGSALRDGDVLRADDGTLVLVRAAAESLSIATTPDAHLLLRGAYHLGNRHVPLQLGDGWLAYEHDHVLDDMVRGLGLNVEPRNAPFEPEGGAHGHSHEHGHHHDHGDHHHHP